MYILITVILLLLNMISCNFGKTLFIDVNPPPVESKDKQVFKSLNHIIINPALCLDNPYGTTMLEQADIESIDKIFKGIPLRWNSKLAKKAERLINSVEWISKLVIVKGYGYILDDYYNQKDSTEIVDKKDTKTAAKHKHVQYEHFKNDKTFGIWDMYSVIPEGFFAYRNLCYKLLQKQTDVGALPMNKAKEVGIAVRLSSKADKDAGFVPSSYQSFRLIVYFQ